MSRAQGMLPSYVSGLNAETNSSINLPPYPEDSSFPNEDPPPYPIDEISFRNNLPSYPLGLGGHDSVNNPVNIHLPITPEDKNCTAPSAPTICDLDHKIGLTPTERGEIVEALLQMKRTLEGQTEIKRKEFWNAQRKLNEVLFSAQSKLTNADKDEFLNEVKRIKQIKNKKDLRRLKEERIECLRREAERRRLQRNKEIEEANKCYCDLWSILFKLFQLVMVMLSFAEYNQWSMDNVLYHNDKTTTRLFIILSSFTTIPTIFLLIFYFFGRRPPLALYKAECIYYIMCMLAYYSATFVQSWKSLNVPVFGLGAMLGYAFDIIRIYCHVRNSINFPNNYDSVDLPLKNSDNKSPLRKISSVSRNGNSTTEHEADAVKHSDTNVEEENLFNHCSLKDDNCGNDSVNHHSGGDGSDSSDCHFNGSYHRSCSNLPTKNADCKEERYAILQTTHNK